MKLQDKERTLRAKLLKKYQQVGEQQLEEQRERVRQLVQTSSMKSQSSIAPPPEPKHAEKPAYNQVPNPTSPAEQEITRYLNDRFISNLFYKAKFVLFIFCASFRPTNGNIRHQEHGNRPVSGHRPHSNQFNDRRKDDFPNYQNQNHHQRNPNFSRKRHQPSESFHPSVRQEQNRGEWKRNRYEGQSNWTSQFDQELWDGPNVDFQRQNSRGGFRGRGYRSGNAYHTNRPRDYPPIKERYSNKPEMRHSNSMPGNASENHLEAVSVTDRPI